MLRLNKETLLSENTVQKEYSLIMTGTDVMAAYIKKDLSAVKGCAAF